MKNQLFRISPDLKVSLTILNLFGISDFEDNHSFTKYNLKELDTVNKMQEIIDDLNKYYLPCKSKVYLNKLSELYKKSSSFLEALKSLLLALCTLLKPIVNRTELHIIHCQDLPYGLFTKASNDHYISCACPVTVQLNNTGSY